MATTPAHAADSGGLRHGGQTSLCDAVEQYEKDLIVDALKSARGNRGGRRRGCWEYRERIIGYKVRKYGIEGRAASRGGQWSAHASALESVGR